MEYEYRSDDGDVVTRTLPMSEAPPLGHTIRRNGKRYRRVPSLFRAAPKPELNFSSNQLPRKDPDAPRLDSKNRPHFQSWKEIREYCAKKEGAVEYDPEGGYPTLPPGASR